MSITPGYTSRQAITYFLCYTLFILFPNLFPGQNSGLGKTIISESELLKLEIQNSTIDSITAKLYGKLAWELKFTDPKEAILAANKEINIGTGLNNYLLLADGYRAKALTLVIQERIIEGLKNYDSCLFFAKKANSLYYEASCLSLIGGLYGDKADYDKAIEFYTNGLEVAKRSNDPKMIATLSNNLAETYQSDYRNSLLTQKYFLMALENSVKIKNWPVATMNSANLAKEYLNNKEIEKTKTELVRTIELLNKDKKDAYQFATNSHILASVYLGLNDLPESEKFAINSLRIMDSLKRPDNVLRPLRELTNIYIASNNIAKAETFTKRLLQDAIQQNAKLYIRDGYEALSKISKIKNDYKQSLRFYELYKIWNDSVFEIGREQSISNIETRAKIAQTELEVRYETEKKERENKILIDQNKDLESEKIIAIIVSLIFILLGTLLYFSNRKKNKINNELQNEKKIVEQQAKDKEILLQEIHHRVKNNLQIISGLLELQKEELTDPASKAAFDEGQSRINSISLIHQNLYQNENLASIEFKKFVQDLSQQVKEVFESLSHKVNISINLQKQELDIDTAVPLGLIVNELLTNSYKYAISKNKDCVIIIELQTTTIGNYILIYSDNGTGLKKEINFEESNTMGLRLIKGLADQIGGKAAYKFNNGAQFTIEFKNGVSRMKN